MSGEGGSKIAEAPVPPPQRPRTPLIANIPLQSDDLSGTYYEESNIFEDVAVHFVMPDGTLKNCVFKSGETIKTLKKTISEEFGVPYSKISFVFDG